MLFEKVAKVISNTVSCKLEDIRPESELVELGVDSLKTITLIFELEEAFDVVIPNEAITSIVTVDDILGKLDSFSA